MTFFTVRKASVSHDDLELKVDDYAVRFGFRQPVVDVDFGEHAGRQTGNNII